MISSLRGSNQDSECVQQEVSGRLDLSLAQELLLLFASYFVPGNHR